MKNSKHTSFKRLLLVLVVLSVVGFNMVLLSDSERNRLLSDSSRTDWHCTVDQLEYWENYPEKLEQVTTLYVYLKGTQYIPKDNWTGLASFKQLKNLLIVGAQKNNVYLPQELAELEQLELLRVNHFNQVFFPSEKVSLKKLKNLKVLDLKDNQLRHLPARLGELTSLERLYLANNELKSLGTKLDHLKNLEYLDLNFNELSVLPTGVYLLPNLQVCLLSYNNFAALRLTPNGWANLRKLNVSQNRIEGVSTSFWKMKHLEELNFANNQLRSLPDTSKYKSLTKLRSLNLTGNPLASANLSFIGTCTALTYLRLSATKINTLPSNFKDLTGLKELYLDNNRLKDFPPVLRSYSNLAKLDLQTNNMNLDTTRLDFLPQYCDLFI